MKPFPASKTLSVPIVYTGFVTPKPAPDAGAKLRQELGIDREDILIVASAGGGTVGNTLLEAVVEAFEFMNIDKPVHHLHVFTGPFLGDDAFERLRRIPKPACADFSLYPGLFVIPCRRRPVGEHGRI